MSIIGAIIAGAAFFGFGMVLTHDDNNSMLRNARNAFLAALVIYALGALLTSKHCRNDPYAAECDTRDY